MSLLIQTDSGTPAASRNIAINRSGDDPTQGRNHLRRSQTQMPHRIALLADKMQGFKNSDVVHSSAAILSAAPLTYFSRRDDLAFVVFCFTIPKDADAFCERFGWKRLA